LADPQPAPQRRTVVIERHYDATPGRVWELWTTKVGIESWWGPPGFRTEVTALDVRPGGRFVYVMTAFDPEVIEFVERRGVPVSTESQVTFDEVVPGRRLATRSRVDFVPGVEPYEVGMTMDLKADGTGTQVTVRLEAMHDEHWTDLAVQGWSAQLDKLSGVL